MSMGASPRPDPSPSPRLRMTENALPYSIMRRHVAFAVLLIAATACNGSLESPTAPASSARLSFVVTTTSSHAIRKANLTFDGHQVATAEVAGGGGQVTLEATVNAAPGSH